VVADSDQFARDALREPAIRSRLVEWWGNAIVDPASGEIDRRKVASIVFADPAQRKQLENLTHPWIEQRRRQAFSEAGKGARALVIDAPLLLEAGLSRECDAIVFVEAPAAVRSSRAETHRHWTHAQWEAREAAQMPLDEKRRMADHVVVNSGDLNDLRAAVTRTLDQIIARHKGHLGR
jgi:dephospho-CoA kinase